jgi:uncharacterized protein
MSTLLLFSLVTLGSLVSSLTGLGGGTLILAGLLLFLPPQLAIALHTFTQLSSNLLRSSIFIKEINWRIVGFYALLMIPGAWLGAELFHLFNPSWLKIIVGLLILASLLPLPSRVTGTPGPRTFIILGGLSGFLGVFVGATGPMVTPFFNRLKLSRQGNLSTKSAGQSLLQLSKIFAFSEAIDFPFVDFKHQILTMILGTFLGVALSIPLSKRIPDRKFDLIINTLLGLIAVKVIYEGMVELI